MAAFISAGATIGSRQQCLYLAYALIFMHIEFACHKIQHGGGKYTYAAHQQNSMPDYFHIIVSGRFWYQTYSIRDAEYKVAGKTPAHIV